MPELLAGTTILAVDTPPAVWAEEGTNFNVTSDSFTTSGAPVLGIAFIAPTVESGTLHLSLFGDSDNTTPVGVVVSPRVRTGDVIGSGTEHQAPTENWSVSIGQAGEPNASGGVAVDVTGLTPGAAYNAVLEHRRMDAGGTGTVFHRTIKWIPD